MQKWPIFHIIYVKFCILVNFKSTQIFRKINRFQIFKNFYLCKSGQYLCKIFVGNNLEINHIFRNMHRLQKILINANKPGVEKYFIS